MRPGWRTADCVNHVLGLVDYAPHQAMPLVHEAPLDAALEQPNAVREETERVDQDYRTAVQPEPLPGDRFEQFLERAASSWHRDHRIDFVDHKPLSLVQIVHDDQFAESAMAPFEVVHEAGQHSDYASALGEGRVS